MPPIPTRAASDILVGVVGILLSVVTIASHRAHTEAVIHRTEANDQWGYYQAKKIRENTRKWRCRCCKRLAPDPAKTEAIGAKLEAARDKYAADAEKIQEDAQARKTRRPRGKSIARCVSTSAKDCWNWAWCCAPCIFWRASGFFPIFGMLASLAGTVDGHLGFLL